MDLMRNIHLSQERGQQGIFINGIGIVGSCGVVTGYGDVKGHAFFSAKLAFPFRIIRNYTSGSMEMPITADNPINHFVRIGNKA
jgi:hypothetical protein